MNLLKTHLLLGQENEQQLRQESMQTKFPINTGLNGDGKFWDGANLMGIINTIGGTWSQIEQARNGKPVYVQGANGGKQDIAPMLMAKLEQQAQTQQTSSDNLFKAIQLQIQSQQDQKPKDNTLLYVGIGAGALVLLTGVYMMTKK